MHTQYRVNYSLKESADSYRSVPGMFSVNTVVQATSPSEAEAIVRAMTNNCASINGVTPVGF